MCGDGFPSWECSCGERGCTSPAKHPLCRGGVKSASRSPDQIRNWWNAWPDANIGVALGLSGLIALDIDGPVAAAEHLRLEAEHGPWPCGAQVTTWRGEHRYARDPGGRLRSRLGGVEFHRGWHYMLVPPGIHRSGRRYRGTGPLRAPVLPPRWIAALASRAQPAARIREAAAEAPGGGQAGRPGGCTPYGGAVLCNALERLASATEGNRNDTLCREARTIGRYAAGGEIEERTALSQLASVALEIGLGEAEISRTIESCVAFGKQMPTRAPSGRRRPR